MANRRECGKRAKDAKDLYLVAAGVYTANEGKKQKKKTDVI